MVFFFIVFICKSFFSMIRCIYISNLKFFFKKKKCIISEEIDMLPLTTSDGARVF
jgi:hypothetical protein